MLKDPNKTPIKVNSILGKQPSIGPIPADQILPWGVIIIITYSLTNGFFDLGMSWFLGLSLWLCTTWWIATGSKPYKLTDKFASPPGRDWCDGKLHYLSPVAELRPPYLRCRYKDHQIKIKAKPISTQLPKEGTARVMPFQNSTDLLTIVQIEKDDRKITGYLLSKGKDYQVIFGFKSKGIHNILQDHEAANLAKNLEEGLKDIPPQEKMTIYTRCGSDRSEEERLETIADNCQTTPIAVLVRNKQKRIQELTNKGYRQKWEQYIFVSWTYNEKTEEADKDLAGKITNWTVNTAQNIAAKFTGNETYYKQNFYKQLLIKAYEKGFIPWELLLTTKTGLQVKPLNDKELWEFIWKRFNKNEASEIPQKLILKETNEGYSLKEKITTHKHATTVLIEGNNGRSSCPEHRRAKDRIWLPGLDRQCAIMTMEEPPKGWINTKSQLQWLWKIASSDYVRDTEIIAELTMASDFIIKDNLNRLAKQSKTSRERSAKKGQGFDVGAEVKQEQSYEAQKKMYVGAKALHCATVLKIYRPTKEELAQACGILANSFGSAKVIRERNIAWKVWLETLPITASRLLCNSSIISERRLTFDTETAPGIMPLTMVREIDRKGVEFVTKGGRPIFVDLMHDRTARAIITGESGSGKSVLGFEFMVDALANNIPVVGMDISSGTTSTFETAIALLGNKGAYYDITKNSSNLLEPPDLRKFSPEERERRLDRWKDSMRMAITAIAMGKVKNPRLSQKVDAIALLALKKFLEDPDIADRYNKAFKHGWKSQEWQQMPTLHDFLKFCTKERLNLKHFTELDRAALAQITTQCTALLNSPMGKAIGRPSSFSPEPMVKFFALSGLANEQDQYLMAISAHNACLRCALSNPKTLFIGDELSILFKKESFAQMVGELYAVGRKAGISMLSLAQDINSIADCVAGEMIMQNTNYRITGRLTQNGANAWVQKANYPPSIINKNATETFKPDKTTLCSKWLIESSGRFWQARYYPAEMILAAVANNPLEQEARQRVMTQYPNTFKGRLMAIKDFAIQYANCISQSIPIETIKGAS